MLNICLLVKSSENSLVYSESDSTKENALLKMIKDLVHSSKKLYDIRDTASSTERSYRTSILTVPVKKERINKFYEKLKHLAKLFDCGLHSRRERLIAELYTSFMYCSIAF